MLQLVTFIFDHRAAAAVRHLLLHFLSSFFEVSLLWPLSLLLFSLLNQSFLLLLFCVTDLWRASSHHPLLVRGQRSNKPGQLGSEAPWEPPRLALTSERPPSCTHTSSQTHTLLLLLQVSSQRRHILHGGVAARNKVQQENLTGIFLFVPELSVNAPTDRTLVWEQPPPSHENTRHRLRNTKNTDAAFYPTTNVSQSLLPRRCLKPFVFFTHSEFVSSQNFQNRETTKNSIKQTRKINSAAERKKSWSAKFVLIPFCE